MKRDVNQWAQAWVAVAGSMRVACLTLLFAGSAVTVEATAYYVSTTGDDGNSGTSVDAPFLTPQRCADVAGAGDTCYFRGGVFRSSSTILSTTRSGATGNPITFKNYSSEIPVFNVTTYAANGYGVHIFDHSWIVIDGLKIVGGDYGIVLDEGASHSQVLNSDVSRGYRGGIKVGTNCSNNLIKGNRIVDNNHINWPRGTADANGEASGSAVSMDAGSDNNLFENNYVYWNHGEGVVFGQASNNIARRNVIADNWSENIRLGGGDSVVTGNFIYLSEAAKAWPATQGDSRSNAGGIAISVDASKGFPVGIVQITNNIVVNARACIHAWSEASGSTFRRWTLSNNTCVLNDSGIALENSGAGITSLLVQNNIILGSDSPGNPIVQIQPAATASRFRNNIYSGAADGFVWADQAPRGFAGWISASREATSSFTDPLLVDASAKAVRLWDDPELGPGSPETGLSIREYSPTASSPAIDAGIDAPGSDRRDHRGAHRDIGALEFCDPGDTGSTDSTSGLPVCDPVLGLPPPPARHIIGGARQ